MSQYVTPMLVLNLGSEMIFVIAQRLQAQNIPHERATLGDIFVQGTLRTFDLLVAVISKIPLSTQRCTMLFVCSLSLCIRLGLVDR